MKKGIVSLISPRFEEVVRQNKYEGITNRNAIVESWRKEYGKRFYECIVQIAPEIENVEAINHAGKNIKYKRSVNNFKQNKV